MMYKTAKLLIAGFFRSLFPAELERRALPFFLRQSSGKAGNEPAASQKKRLYIVHHNIYSAYDMQKSNFPDAQSLFPLY